MSCSLDLPEEVLHGGEVPPDHRSRDRPGLGGIIDAAGSRAAFVTMGVSFLVVAALVALAARQRPGSTVTGSGSAAASGRWARAQVTVLS